MKKITLKDTLVAAAASLAIAGALGWLAVWLWRGFSAGASDFEELGANSGRVRRAGSGLVFLAILAGVSAIASVTFAVIAGWVCVHWARHRNDPVDD
jgi:flagellar biosynthesis component FlhA